MEISMYATRNVQLKQNIAEESGLRACTVDIIFWPSNFFWRGRASVTAAAATSRLSAEAVQLENCTIWHSQVMWSTVGLRNASACAGKKNGQKTATPTGPADHKVWTAQWPHGMGGRYERTMALPVSTGLRNGRTNGGSGAVAQGFRKIAHNTPTTSPNKPHNGIKWLATTSLSSRWQCVEGEGQRRSRLFRSHWARSTDLQSEEHLPALVGRAGEKFTRHLRGAPTHPGPKHGISRKLSVKGNMLT